MASPIPTGGRAPAPLPGQGPGPLPHRRPQAVAPPTNVEKNSTIFHQLKDLYFKQDGLGNVFDNLNSEDRKTALEGMDHFINGTEYNSANAKPLLAKLKTATKKNEIDTSVVDQTIIDAFRTISRKQLVDKFDKCMFVENARARVAMCELIPPCKKTEFNYAEEKYKVEVGNNRVIRDTAGEEIFRGKKIIIEDTNTNKSTIFWLAPGEGLKKQPPQGDPTKFIPVTVEDQLLIEAAATMLKEKTSSA